MEICNIFRDCCFVGLVKFPNGEERSVLTMFLFRFFFKHDNLHQRD
jgi:hypothetical protein